MSGSAPAVKTHEANVTRLATALTADARFNDTAISDSKLDTAESATAQSVTAKSVTAKFDDSSANSASIAGEQQAVAPSKIELPPVAGTTLEIAKPEATAAATPEPTPAPVVVASAAPEAIVTASLTPTETLPGEAVPDQAASASVAATPSADGDVEVVDDCIVLESCVDRYLWTLYHRAPKEDAVKVEEQRQVTVKRKGKQVSVTRTVSHVADEDFAWKDPKAADKANMSVTDYVIGGMDHDFKLRLFQMLHAAEQAGLAPGITSAFRDDYRQSIASGLKAADNRSYHGGSLHGGYGHGLAADIVSVKGATRADRLVATNILWSWIDKNGKDFGIGRPYLGRDPPHCAPIDGEEYAKHQPGRARQASQAMALAKHPPVRAARQASLATARKLVMATH